MVSKRTLWAVVAAFLAVALGTGTAAAQSADEASQLYAKWQIEEADQILDELVDSEPDRPAVQFLRARSDFLHGRYKQSLGRLDQLLTNETSGRGWKDFRDLVEATHEVTKDYETYESPEGRFKISVPSGADRVLVPYAGEALDRAWEVLGEELGYRPPTPIRVEVYPQTSTLAKVSGLTDQEIRASGTIALCKYNRLMITSPSALLRGYEWVDTLVHEYIHFVINKKTSNSVPIWMHEGLAKFLEHRWRGPDAHRLPPSTEQLLDKRLKADDLITFEQMHPSMAKLPNQEDAATAFAEVYTVMEYLENENGATAFKELLEAVPEAGGARRAFEQVVGTSFSAFEDDWKAYLHRRETPEYPEGGDWQRRLVFKDDNPDEKPGSLEELDKPKAQEHMKLGEMLQARSRYGAAVVQYRKAMRLSETPNPRLRSRLAHSLTKTGSPEEAIDVLEAVRNQHPSQYNIWIELGKASLAVDKPREARDQLLEAAWINPFDPEVHTLLADAYEALGDVDKAERERKFAKLVQ